MRISITDVKGLVKSINKPRAFENVPYNPIGALHLYQDGIGIAIDEIMNSGGGVKRLAGGGLTKSEAYYYLVELNQENCLQEEEE